MLRKWFSIIMVLVLVLSIVGCSAQTANNAGDSTSTGTETQQQSDKSQGETPKGNKDIKVGIVVNGQGNFFNTGIYQETIRLVKEMGGTPVALDSLGQREKMLSDLESLIQQNVDAIIVLLGDPTFLEPALKQAKEKNIPWISVASGFHPLVDLQIDSNDWANGAKIGAYLAARLGGKGKIVEIYGDLIMPTRARAEGLRAVLKEYPEISSEE